MHSREKDRNMKKERQGLASKSEPRSEYIKKLIADLLYTVLAGFIVGTAYHFFQNSNGFAPGGVGGLATITHHLTGGEIGWTYLMLAFNLPIFVLVAIFINKRLGLILSAYMLVQSFMPKLYDALGAMPYSLENSGEDFNVIFACIATGVISGFGFSLMLKRFGASGGTYGISALIRRARPELNVAYVSFIMDASVVFIAFFVYGMKVTPVICTLLNLFIANVLVDNGLAGIKNGYKFLIVTTNPEELSKEIMSTMRHGITKIAVHGMYTDTDKYMLMCIINKRQIGEMMKLLKAHPDCFATFEKVNEVFGNFKRRV